MSPSTADHNPNELKGTYLDVILLLGSGKSKRQRWELGSAGFRKEPMHNNQHDVSIELKASQCCQLKASQGGHSKRVNTWIMIMDEWCSMRYFSGHMLGSVTGISLSRIRPESLRAVGDDFLPYCGW